ncbi:EF-hand calcium-binding domain-containing protein 5-like [Hemitrygon akajei]|uniref:EF-hand calcium-binding domain-containing protein 5-like n=1 Tax=Hemitrygon akajei TaxID=2704970 RepID=UPI003BF9E36E
MDNEDQTEGITEAGKKKIFFTSGGVADADDGNKFHSFSRRSSLTDSSTAPEKDEADKNKIHLRTSLVDGIIDHITDEDGGGSDALTDSALHVTGVIANENDSNKFHLASKESVSPAAEATDHVTDKEARSEFQFSSKRSTSFPAEVTDHASVTEARKKYQSVSNRSSSLARGIINHVADDDDDIGKFSEGSASSAHNVTAIDKAAADKDDRNKFHKASKKSVFLMVGITDREPKEDNKEDFIELSKSSIPIDTETITNKTHEEQSRRFSFESKRSISFPGIIDSASEKEFSDAAKQYIKRSYSLGSRATADEDRHKDSEAEEINTPISNPISVDIHATGRERNKTNFQLVGLSSELHEPKSPSTRQAKLETKRTSFQTSVIEGFSISDAKEDDEDEGAKDLWKKIFERKVTKRVLNIQRLKIVLLEKRKHGKANLEKRIPMDLLAKEWFSENTVTVQTRIYLLEKLLPTLILGLENLLIEVEKKKLTVLERPHPYFNPINFLAQFLMRNNPRHCKLPEEDSYLLGLQQVTQELKIHVTDVKDNRLACLKLETKWRRKEREQQERLYAANQAQRRENLRMYFRDWMLSTNGNVLLSLAQSVLVFFSEGFADYLFETFEDVRYDKELEEIDTTGKMLNEEEFVEYQLDNEGECKESAVDLGKEGFYRKLEAKPSLFKGECKDKDFCQPLTNRRMTQGNLTNLKSLARMEGDFPGRYKAKGLDEYNACKTNGKGTSVSKLEVGSKLGIKNLHKSGLLNRKRILSLFEEFYDQHSGKDKHEFHNPRKWPIVELNELDPEVFMLDFGNDYISPQVPAYSHTEKKGSTGQMNGDETDQLLLQRGLDNGDTGQDHVEETKDAAQAMLTPQSLSASADEFYTGVHSQFHIPEEVQAKLAKFPDLATNLLDLQAQSLSLNTSPFKKDFINTCQFVQLMELFVGDTTEPLPQENLVKFIRERYKETREEKLEKLAQANHEIRQKAHETILSALFEKWDNDVSGYVNLRELAEVISKYKDGAEKKSLKNAHHRLKLHHKYHSDNPTLTKSEFTVYIETIVDEMSGKEVDFDGLVTFLTARSEQNCVERARLRARRKWFSDIKQSAVISDSSMAAVFKTVFQVLFKDSEAHGGNKKISSSIALLRRNFHRPERGEYFLHYVACTLEDAPYVLNQALYRDMGVSFAAINEGKPLYIYRVQDHGKVHFWNCHRETPEGSFLVVPVKDQHNRVFGVLGTDTLRDECGKVFASHEINFHQGVAKAFSIAYHHVQVRDSVLKAVNSGMMWLFNITPSVETGITYLTEPTTVKEYVLCKTMTSENDPIQPWSDVHVPSMILKRKDNYFRNYLFRCADTSLVVLPKVSERNRVCLPLRDIEGRTLAILDIDIGVNQELLAHEYRSMLKMLHILYQACALIVKEAAELSGTLPEDSDHEYKSSHKLLFHRLLLQDMSQNLSRLDEKELEKLKSSGDPPPMVHEIFKIVIHLVKPNNNVEVLTWSEFKEEMNRGLIELICSFNPIKTVGKIKTTLLEEYFKALSQVLRLCPTLRGRGVQSGPLLFENRRITIDSGQETQEMRERHAESTKGFEMSWPSAIQSNGKRPLSLGDGIVY